MDDIKDTKVRGSIKFGLIGNQKSSAVIDKYGTIVWAIVSNKGNIYVPFNLRLSFQKKHSDFGFFSIQIRNVKSIKQNYLHQAPVLETRFKDFSGNILTVTDFVPFCQNGNDYISRRLVAKGTPLVKIIVKPVRNNLEPIKVLKVKGNIINFETFSLLTSEHINTEYILKSKWFEFNGNGAISFGYFSSLNNICMVKSIKDTCDYWNNYLKEIILSNKLTSEVKTAVMLVTLCYHKQRGAFMKTITPFMYGDVDQHKIIGDEYKTWDLQTGYLMILNLSKLGIADKFLEHKSLLIELARNRVHIDEKYYVDRKIKFQDRVNHYLCGSVDEFLDSEDYEEENEITETKWEKLKENICDIVSDSERKYYCCIRDKKIEKTISECERYACFILTVFLIDISSSFRYDHLMELIAKMVEWACLIIKKWESVVEKEKTNPKCCVNTYQSALCWSSIDAMKTIHKIESFGVKTDYFSTKSDEMRRLILEAGWDNENKSYMETLNFLPLPFKREPSTKTLLLPKTGIILYENIRYIQTIKFIESSLFNRGFLLSDTNVPIYLRSEDIASNFWYIEALTKTDQMEKALNHYQKMKQIYSSNYFPDVFALVNIF